MVRKDLMSKFIDQILMVELQRYFTAHPDQYDELRQIITNKRGPSKKKTLPSLRGLEYVTTHMAKMNDLAFFYQNEMGEQVFCDIYHLYKTTLGDFKKKHFDSFRRTAEIEFQIPDHPPIKTTIAQMQWGRWIYEQSIMLWVKDHWPEVRKRMAASLKDQRAPKKRRRIVKKAPKQSVRSGKITITW